MSDEFTRDAARIVRPPNKLKEKIGADVNVRELLKSEVTEGAQQVIAEKVQDYLQWTKRDLSEMEQAWHRLQQHPEDFDPIVLILQKAESLRDRSGTFGYPLASQIAKSLGRYCRQLKDSDKHAGIVIRKHLDGLQTVFREDIHDTGGPVGIQLMDGLQKLIAKYHAE